MKGICYLAGPVTNTAWTKARDWRKLVTEELNDAGIEVLDPTRHGLLTIDALITEFCYNDVKRCDVILVNFLDTDRISVGTLLEVGWAYALGKPIVLMSNQDYEWDYGIYKDITKLRSRSLMDGVADVRSVIG